MDNPFAADKGTPQNDPKQPEFEAARVLAAR